MRTPVALPPEGPMTVWVYVNTSKQVGDKDHLKVFADEDAATTSSLTREFHCSRSKQA
jgi:hypothetical protein